MKPEHALAILVVDSNRRYSNRRLERKWEETIEDFADRVRAEIVAILTQVNS